ncbi:MAG: hypothetical protein IJ533_02925 [Prevotella sp.]|nr:hypothetical protein [Prevotella sp.]
MKKILLAAVAAVLMCACSGERGYLDYRGLSMGLPARQVADSLQQRGLALDTAHSTAGSYVLADTLKSNYVVTVYHRNDTITDILEQYTATYNDSTANLWQAMHDDLQKEFGWPNMGKHGDLHKEATFENDKGTVLLILLNTYSPTMSVRYSTSTTQD